MKNIAGAIKRLNARKSFAVTVSRPLISPLKPLPDFGSNPGNLRAWHYVPIGLAIDAPLVVVLHGCTQTAAEYDIGSGWSQLAEKHGFALLFPEQQRSNNPNLCFNWFATADTTRGHGEVLSISQMIAAVIERQSLNRSKTFVTGLSAGGAMAGAMLATSVIKAYSINGMGHGAPIQTNGATSCGQARPFILDAGISSTWHIAKSWNLIQEEVAIRDVFPYAPNRPRVQQNGYQSDGTIIEKAMRAAGLMK